MIVERFNYRVLRPRIYFSPDKLSIIIQSFIPFFLHPQTRLTFNDIFLYIWKLQVWNLNFKCLLII